jgi:hypothetical protein
MRNRKPRSSSNRSLGRRALGIAAIILLFAAAVASAAATHLQTLEFSPDIVVPLVALGDVSVGPGQIAAYNFGAKTVSITTFPQIATQAGHITGYVPVSATEVRLTFDITLNLPNAFNSGGITVTPREFVVLTRRTHHCMGR